MKKNGLLKRILLVAMCFVLVASAACKDEGTPASSAPPTDTSNTPVDPGVGDTYTYNYFLEASPLTWNPHSWETNADSELNLYIVTPFVDVTIADDGVNFEWVYEGATAVTDITATFADREKWGIEADEDGEEPEGLVYQIDLNPALVWDDGTQINADSYIYSMQQQLDPAMKNYRANSYTSGTFAIQGALGYFMNDMVGMPMYGDAAGAEAPADGKYFLNVDEIPYFFGDGSMMEYSGGGYADYFMVNEENIAEKYAGQGYIEVTDEIKAELLGVAANFGDDNPEAWMEFCFVVTGVYEETPWEDVGLLKTGEYQLVYICQNPVSFFDFMISCGSGWLVHEGLYEAGKETREGLVATNYATTLETTANCGPYKLVSFEKDKQIVLTRNETWYGWTDGKHDGQYQTTDIRIDIVPEHTTALQLFTQGNLDNIPLEAGDMPVYRMSDYLRKTDQSYTFRFIFATDLESLKALESEANDGANKQVLSYDDFRKAISLSIDRARLCAEATAAYKPAYYLLNNLYYYNIENDPSSIYRLTDEAKEAVLRLYDMSYGAGTPYADIDAAYAAVTGYNEDAARELFQSVYEQAIADGLYTDGQAININAMISAATSLSPDDNRQQDLLNEFVAAATKGTGFEDKITFTFKCGAEKRYDDVANGRIEMIRGAWGGAYLYPFSTIRVYTEPDYMGGLAKIHESNGWNPSVETLDITYDFDGDGTAETVTDTFQRWAQSINDNGPYAGVGQREVAMVILSYLETGVLSAYQCIPWAAETIVDMYSMQVEWATLNYNVIYGYGGLRLMTYNYSDAEWDAFVADQGGQLNYE